MKTFMQKFSLITPLFSELKRLMPFYSLENNAQRLTKSFTRLTDVDKTYSPPVSPVGD